VPAFHDLRRLRLFFFSFGGDDARCFRMNASAAAWLFRRLIDMKIARRCFSGHGMLAVPPHNLLRPSEQILDPLTRRLET
jgi:hypothetical protein